MMSSWKGRQPDDPKPIFYHGCLANDAATMRAAGLKAYCLSYYWGWQGKNWKPVTSHPGYNDPECRAFLDSGAFSYLAAGYSGKASRVQIEREVDTYVEAYARWTQTHGKRFDFYVTFDYVVEAPVVYQVTQRLQKLGIRPVPVYHGDASISWLRRYIDEGHKLIGISKRFFLNDGRGLRRYYDQVFNITEKCNVACHGFACTGADMWRYPWYSVDSTSFVKDNGTILYETPKGDLQKVSICRTAASRQIDDALLEQVRDAGFAIDDLRSNRSKRLTFNAVAMQRFVLKKKGQKCQRKTTLF
jgi:hypothetical protein